MTKKTRTRRKDKDASLAKLTDPQFVTLVSAPANRTGFRVIRGDDDDEKSTMEKVTAQGRKRKRSDANLVSISLPAGIDRSTAEEVVNLFALGDDYDLVEVDGSFVLRRTNADDKTTFPVDMGDGFMANIDAAAIARSDKFPPKPGKGDQRPGEGAEKKDIALVRMSFASDKFADANAVVDWHTSHDMECEASSVEEDVEGTLSVKRYDTDQEIRQVNLGDGVTCHIIRASEYDLPGPIAGAVVCEAYGNWGWGQLDFSAAMADPKFTEQSWDALYVLRDVLENIVFYSSLPVDERKGLVKSACDQYVAYMGQLIDALPKVVVAQVNNSDRKSKLENVMKTEDKKAEGQAAPEQLTRSDVQEMITAAVAALAAVPADAPVALPDETPRVEDSKVERRDGTDKILEALAGVIERMDSMDSDLKGLKCAEEDAVVVRSDNADVQPEKRGPETKRSDSVFSGVFASLGL